jgi:hypothetical protein
MPVASVNSYTGTEYVCYCLSQITGRKYRKNAGKSLQPVFRIPVPVHTRTSVPVFTTGTEYANIDSAFLNNADPDTDPISDQDQNPDLKIVSKISARSKINKMKVFIRFSHTYTYIYFIVQDVLKYIRVTFYYRYALTYFFASFFPST